MKRIRRFIANVFLKIGLAFECTAFLIDDDLEP